MDIGYGQRYVVVVVVDVMMDWDLMSHVGIRMMYSEISKDREGVCS